MSRTRALDLVRCCVTGEVFVRECLWTPGDPPVVIAAAGPLNATQRAALEARPDDWSGLPRLDPPDQTAGFELLRCLRHEWVARPVDPTLEAFENG